VTGMRDQRSATAAPPRDNRLRGIAIMCIAVIFFTTIDTIGKYLGQFMPVNQVVWGRFVFAFMAVCLLPIPGVSQYSPREIVGSKRLWLQIVRGFLLLGSTMSNLAALQFLQLDQALAIMFSAPLMVAALSIPMLCERVGPRRWAAIAVGFCGVLVVARPGAGGIHPAALLSLLCALLYALYSIVTRMLARDDSSETTFFYSNLPGAIVMTLALPFIWHTPSYHYLYALMVTQGVVAALGHYLLIRAHRIAPASVLSPFMYTQIVWMVSAGYLVFGDLPNRWTLIGSAIVIASGLNLLYRERKVRGEAAPPSGGPIAA
jgi:drug/metabolite transporter (DMT)-like permease